MRVRIVQALALVALLYTIGPHVEPARVELGQIEEHYGQTVQLEGRVASVDTSGNIVRLRLLHEGEVVTVLTRERPPPLGANVTVRGQPSPDEGGPVVWAEGTIQTQAEQTISPVALAHVLEQAPRLVGQPIAVVGSWDPQPASLTGPAGRLQVDPAGIQPDEGAIVLWGRLTYAPDRAAYQLDATGWRAWSMSPS